MAEVTVEENVALKVRWSDEQPVPQPANQFIVQWAPTGEIVLTFGYASPPVILGTQEEQTAQIRRLAEHGLETRSVARLVLTPKTLQELHDVLVRQFSGQAAAAEAQ